MASTTTEPKLASFLGLATETRLQIYTYLLIPYITHEESKKLQKPPHCCAFPSPSPYRDETQPLACPCKNKNLHPQILCTNHQIFAEGIHILYENMELRVRLPHPVTFRASPLETLIATLPTYAHKHITKIAIIGTTAEASSLHRDPVGHTFSYPLGQYAALITATFPKMRQVRLHVDFGSGGSGRRTAVESFGAVVGIPTLEVVEVEVDGGEMPVWEGNWASCMRARVVGSVRQAAEVAGRRIEVREVVEEGEGMGMGEGLRSFERGRG